MIRHASAKLTGSSAIPRTAASGERPFNPAMRSRSSSKPSRGMTFVSMPRAVPANVIVDPGRRAASSRAMAMPG
jgi:hypothetical protein